MLGFIKRLWRRRRTGELGKDMTLCELKDLWSKEHYKVLTRGGITGYETAWEKCEKLHNKRFLDLKYRDWQDVINRVKETGLRYSSQKKVRNLIGQLYKFAGKYELTDKNYAPLLELDKDIPVFLKEPFSEMEIRKLWENQGEKHVDLVLLLIYTGVRIGELLRVKSEEDIFLDERYFVVRESKTAAGRNRPVPISRKIEPFIRKRMHKEREYLITNVFGAKMNYTSFANRYKKVMKKLGMNHTIHECRHTCATLLDNAGANELAIKRILGHAANDITRKVYTHKKVDDLIKAIDLI